MSPGSELETAGEGLADDGIEVATWPAVSERPEMFIAGEWKSSVSLALAPREENLLYCKASAESDSYPYLTGAAPRGRGGFRSQVRKAPHRGGRRFVDVDAGAVT